MQVRCPNCNNPMDVLGEESLSELTCESCQSNFSLTGDDKTQIFEPNVLTQIAHFKLHKVIGSGAFGQVWKAEDTELDRVVAIKIPRKGELDPRESEQFLREARAAAQLQHPNIVSVHEVGRDKETIYIVSDYIDGITLADFLTGQRLSIENAVKMCIKVANGLIHAHDSGIIHRDLKPGNIMLDASMEPYVMDFGLAKRETAEITMTAEGKIMGTPAYMSPEQAQGVSQNLDRRSDIYSLGVILFELITGERPFRGNARMLLHQVVCEEPPSPRKLNPSVSRDLETLCLKCLSKDPDKRYSTTLAFREELERYLRNEPIMARPISTPERFWRWCRRNPTVSALSGILATMLIVGSIVAVIAAVRFHGLAEQAQADAASAEESRRMESEARSNEASLREELDVTLADTYTSFGLLAGDINDFTQASLWFAKSFQHAKNDTNRLRSNQVRFQNWSRHLSIPAKVFQHASSVSEITFHVGNQYLLARTFHPEMVLWDIKNEIEIELGDAKTRPVIATWSADGKWLALARKSKNQCEVFEFPSMELQQQIPFSSPISTLSFNQGGNQIAIGGKSLLVWDLESRKPVVNEILHPTTIRRIVFDSQHDRVITSCDKDVRVFDVAPASPGDRLLVGPIQHESETVLYETVPPFFVGQDQGLITQTGTEELTRWDAGTGDVVNVFPDVGRLFCFAPAPGGNHFVACSSKSAQLYDVKTALAVGPPMQHDNFVYHAAFNRDGNLLATVSADRKAKIWSTKTGAQIGATIPHQSEVTFVTFTNDGKFMATAQDDGVVRIWTLPIQQLHQSRVELETDQSFMALSNDGRYMVPSGWDAKRGLRSIRVYEAATGLALGAELKLKGFFHGAAFSADDSQVVTLNASPADMERAPNPEQLQAHTGSVVVHVWRTGEQVFPPLETPTEPMDVCYSPDGKQFAVVCAAGEILLIDAETGEKRLEMNHGAIAIQRYVVNERLRFTRDGKRLFSFGLGNKVRIWDATNGKLIRELSHDNSFLVYDVQVSSDGKWLASCATTGDCLTAIWNLETGERETVIDHPDWVFHARFGPGTSGDRLLLTACRDGMARLWDWRNKQLLCTAFEHEDDVFEAVFLGDERLIMTSSRDETARIWETHTGKPISPSFKLPGKAYQILLSDGGKNAIVTGSGNTLHIFDLEQFIKAIPAFQNVELMNQISELASGQKVIKGGVVNLTSQQWLEQWKSFHDRFQSQLAELSGLQ